MPTKQYGDPAMYEKKLNKIMEKLNIEKYNYDWNRHGGFVEFWYKDEFYKFEHTVEKAKAKGIKLVYGSDAFAQIVLALEDLARITNRGIYDLQSYIQGVKALPEAALVLPGWALRLHFEYLPESYQEVKRQYRKMAMVMHPDKGGDAVLFNQLQDALEKADEYFEEE